jgi:hypothetical protein
MNDRILELAKKAGLKKEHASDREYVGDFEWREFSNLIIKEHIDLLRQEWYNLNNAPKEENETPRDVGIRVGRKTEIILLINKISNHFGVE